MQLVQAVAPDNLRLRKFLAIKAENNAPPGKVNPCSSSSSGDSAAADHRSRTRDRNARCRRLTQPSDRRSTLILGTHGGRAPLPRVRQTRYRAARPVARLLDGVQPEASVTTVGAHDTPTVAGFGFPTIVVGLMPVLADHHGARVPSVPQSITPISVKSRLGLLVVAGAPYTGSRPSMTPASCFADRHSCMVITSRYRGTAESPLPHRGRGSGFSQCACRLAVTRWDNTSTAGSR